MKNKNLIQFALLLSISLPQVLKAECPGQPGNPVVDEQMKNLFEIKKQLSKKECKGPENVSSLLETDSSNRRHFKNERVPDQFVHDENYCKKIEICTDFDEIQKREFDAKNFFNSKMLLATFQKALWNERKQTPRSCGMEKLDNSCLEELKIIYETKSDEEALTKVQENFKFRNKNLYDKWSATTSKDCPKFNINKVCKDFRANLDSFNKCENENGKDCYHNVQGVLLNLLRDNIKDELNFWALEKELCRPTRIFSPIFDEAKYAQEHPDFVGPVRSPKDDDALEIVPGGSYALNESSEYSTKSSPNLAVNYNKDVGFGLSGTGYVSPSRNSTNDPDSFEVEKSNSVLNNFSAGLKEAYDGHSELDKISPAESNANINANTNFSNFVNHSDNNEKDAIKDESNEDLNPAKKKDEINSLTAQIDSLNKKLSEMSNKLEDLKSNPKSKDEVDELSQNKLSLEKEKAILELKNKIAELEGQKKELISKQNNQVDIKAAQNSIEQPRAIASYSSPIASVNDYEDRSSSKAGGNEQSYTPPPSQSSSGDYGRAPASSSASNSGNSSGGIVLRSSGVAGQAASTENTTVYLTQDEVKNYPYRLDANATDLDIEKMFKESNGAPVLLGESEQVVAVKENGKLVYKRGKIVVVKNEKVKKESISRAISSVADLKKDEEKKSRDFIRYQEMKKGLKLNK